jgi:hypothetical protein
MVRIEDRLRRRLSSLPRGRGVLIEDLQGRVSEHLQLLGSQTLERRLDAESDRHSAVVEYGRIAALAQVPRQGGERFRELRSRRSIGRKNVEIRPDLVASRG